MTKLQFYPHTLLTIAVAVVTASLVHVPSAESKYDSPVEIDIIQETEDNFVTVRFAFFGEIHEVVLKKIRTPVVPVVELSLREDGSLSKKNVANEEDSHYYVNRDLGCDLHRYGDNFEGLFNETLSISLENNKLVATIVDSDHSTSCDAFYHEGKSRQRREAGDEDRKPRPYIVEVGVVVDSVLTNKLSFIDNGETYMKIYWNMVNQRFRRLPGIDLTIRLSQIFRLSDERTDYEIIHKRPGSGLYAKLTLNRMSEYFNKQDLSSNFDIIHLMTSRKLYRLSGVDPNKPILGLAFVNGVCKDISKFSVSHDDGNYYGMLDTAHEVAHNLGADHDGELDGIQCSAKEGYVMQPRSNYRSPNAFSFSWCSARSITNTARRAYCLRNITSIHYYQLNNQFPGYMVSYEQQCEHASPGSVPDINDEMYSDTDYCYALRCKVVYPNGQYKRKHLNVPTLEGTPCGKRGRCMNGNCEAGHMEL